MLLLKRILLWLKYSWNLIMCSVLLILKTNFQPPSRHSSFKTATLHTYHIFLWNKKGKSHISHYIYQFTLREAFNNLVDKIWAFLTSYLPLVDICEEIPLLLLVKICIPLTFPWYHLPLLPTSSCQRSFRTPPNVNLRRYKCVCMYM